MLRSVTLTKRIHWYSHTSNAQTIEMIFRTAYSRGTAYNLCNNIIQFYSICKRAEAPLPTKQVSLSHIYEHPNSENQSHFMYVSFHSTKSCELYIVYGGSGYSERVAKRKIWIEYVTTLLETMWVHRCRCLSVFSAGSTLSERRVKRSLTDQNFKQKKQPVRRKNKTGTIV